jgi:catechol 2,3-dioxygenase
VELNVAPIDPAVDIGRAPQGCRSDRALKFYCDVLGFELTGTLWAGAAFVGAGGYHHHIALNTWESLGIAPAWKHGFIPAIRYPTRAALADALGRRAAGISWGAADHGVSESLYLTDQNGVELYYDRPRSDGRATRRIVIHGH